MSAGQCCDCWLLTVVAQETDLRIFDAGEILNILILGGGGVNLKKMILVKWLHHRGYDL